MVITAVEEYVRALSLRDHAVFLYENPQDRAGVFGAYLKVMLTQYANHKAILDYEKSCGARFNYPLSSICSYDTHELE